jgi:Rrf2 family protein
VKLSKKGEYALRSLINLGIAAEMKRSLVQVSEMAKAEQLPVKFLEQILQALKEAGIVESRRGKFGGYRLGRPANKIFIGEVVRLIDGPLAPIGCVSQTAYERCSCPDEVHCGLRMLMVDVRNAIANILDRYTLADVVEITLRKMRRDSISLPFSAREPGAAASQRVRARAGPRPSRAGRLGRRTRISPSEGVLHHILGEYSI